MTFPAPVETVPSQWAGPSPRCIEALLPQLRWPSHPSPARFYAKWPVPPTVGELRRT